MLNKINVDWDDTEGVYRLTINFKIPVHSSLFAFISYTLAGILWLVINWFRDNPLLYIAQARPDLSCGFMGTAVA